jgi:hypothetical protein
MWQNNPVALYFDTLGSQLLFKKYNYSAEANVPSKSFRGWAPVAHNCNPNYLGG